MLIAGNQGPFNMVRLENTTSRQAFWEGWLEKDGKHWYFCYRFGRLGSTGRPGHTKCNGQVAAQSLLDSKSAEKMKGDYEVVALLAQSQKLGPVTDEWGYTHKSSPPPKKHIIILGQPEVVPKNFFLNELHELPSNQTKLASVEKSVPKVNPVATPPKPVEYDVDAALDDLLDS